MCQRTSTGSRLLVGLLVMHLYNDSTGAHIICLPGPVSHIQIFQMKFSLFCCLEAAQLLEKFLFSRVHATLQPAPSVGRLVGRSVRNTLLFCVIFGHFGSSGVILSHFFVVFGHFWLLLVIFGHF